MPNCIQISDPHGYATLDDTTINNNTTIEFHFRTTNTSKQNIFNLVQHNNLISTAQFWIYLDTNNTIGMSYHTNLSRKIETVSCSFSTNIFDGNWHQASVRMVDSKPYIYVIFYLDGIPVLVNGQPQQQDVPTIFDFSGKIIVGYSPIVEEFSPAPFTGDVAELRVWGDSGLFLPRPSSPISPGTPGLINYWPFWTNFDKGTNLDVRRFDSPTPAIFNNCSLGFVPSLIYDPWNEAILNAQSQPFPTFSDGQQNAAVQDILGQLVALHALESKSESLVALRVLYTNHEKMGTDTLPSGLIRVTPSQSDAAYQAAFELVRQQLLDEVLTVQAVYQFMQDSYNFTVSYYTLLNSVFSAILAANLAPVEFPILVDVSKGLAIAEALFEFLFSAPHERRSTGAIGSFGESAAASISLIISLIDFSVSGDQTQYMPNFALSNTLENIVTQIEEGFSDRLGTVASNGQAIIQNWGKLSVLQVNSDDFNFGFQFSKEMENKIYQSNLVSFSETILTTLYQIWEVQAVESDDIRSVGYYGTSILNPNLSKFLPNTFYKGTWNFFSVCTYDGNPQVLSFTSAPSQSASSFLFNQCHMTMDDVFNWPFTRAGVN